MTTVACDRCGSTKNVSKVETRLKDTELDFFLCIGSGQHSRVADICQSCQVSFSHWLSTQP